MRESPETSAEGEQMGSQLHDTAGDVVPILQHREDGTKRLHHCIFTIFESTSD